MHQVDRVDSIIHAAFLHLDAKGARRGFSYTDKLLSYMILICFWVAKWNILVHCRFKPPISIVEIPQVCTEDLECYNPVTCYYF